jgi:xylulokinase
VIAVGIDAGTQSIRAIALDAESGEVLAARQLPLRLIPGLPPGHLEQHPDEWVAAADEAVGATLAALGDRRGEVAAIGVSGQQHGLVVLDAAGRVVRPAKLWCDTSTAPQCEQFSAAFGGTEGLVALAGNPVLPGYTAPKILWLKQNEPEHFAAGTTYLLPHDYLNFWLTGERRMEFGDASGTGLLDVRSREWCGPLCDFIGPSVKETLPPLRPSSEPAGPLLPALRERWRLPGDVLVSAGGGDNMMGAIGTGNVEPGVVTASLGTSGTLFAYSAHPAVDPAGEAAAFCDSTGGWLPLVCTMNVTVATERMRALFGWDLGTFDSEVARATPGAGGLLFLPYLNGERTPNLPGGSGVLHGMTPANMTPGNFARAAMEGATLGLAYGLGRFRAMGIEPGEIRLIGGGSKSAVWRELAADVFGVPVVSPVSPEGAALGAAIQALWALGDRSRESLAALVARLVQLDPATRVAPHADRSRFYADLLARQTALAASLHGSGHL